MPNQEWRAKKRIELTFNQSLQVLSKKVNRITQSTDSPEEMLNLINAIIATPSWNELAAIESNNLVSRLRVSNAQSWREASRKSQRGAIIYRALRTELRNDKPFYELIHENASKIRTLPMEVASDLSKHIANQTVKGLRPDAMAAKIKAYAPYLASWQVTRLARTQTASTQEAITQIRAQKIGLDAYTWHGALDQRERYAHRRMENVLCIYHNPPNPEELFPAKGIKPYGCYNAGCTFNCRCYSAPVIDLDDLEWPHLVAIGSQLKHYSKAAFARL